MQHASSEGRVQSKAKFPILGQPATQDRFLLCTGQPAQWLACASAGPDALEDGFNTGVAGERGWAGVLTVAGVGLLASAWLTSFLDSGISGAKGF